MPAHFASQSQPRSCLKNKEYEGLNPESSLSNKGPPEITESLFQQKYLSSFEQANKSKTI